MKVELTFVRASGEVPTSSFSSDAGWDLVAAGDVHLPPNERRVVPTGVAIALPANAVALVCPRSGLAVEAGITVLNAPGVIDSGYRGEIGVILVNLSGEEYLVRSGDRIAQLVVTSVAEVTWEVVPHLPTSNRGEGGFGHSGR